MSKWVMVTKRTEDPKLAHFEQILTDHRIPHQRNGYSFHAPIMEVPKEYEEAANDLLQKPAKEFGIKRRGSYDDVPDGHQAFHGCQPHDWYEEEEEHEDPVRDGWVGKDGRP